MLGEIDLKIKATKESLFLCKPDKTTIKKLSEAYDITLSTDLGIVNEINFKIPTLIEKDRVLIENPNINSIRHRYYFKLVEGKSVEYFIFNESNKVFSNEEYIEYKARGLGYQLMDKSIRNLEFVSKNLTEMARESLKYTNWKVGYVDSEFDMKFRQHEVTSQNVLQVIYDLAEKFNAVIVWDTVNLKINFYTPNNIGRDKGLTLDYGKYLESFNMSSNSEEAVTRLKVIGQDELSIRRLTPAGTNYLEDFSWYEYPFEMNAEGEVIKSSYYMSDDLCINLNKYKKLLNDSKGRFEELTSKLTKKQDEIQKKKQELSVLDTELTQILDKIDVSNKNFKADTPEHRALIVEKENKITEIQAITNIINYLIVEEDGISSNISELRISLTMENTLTPENIIELNEFIIEKEYHNDSIVDEQDLLEDGLEAFKNFREPKIRLDIGIVNFLEIVECQNDWDKLVLGDIVRVRHKRLGTDIKAKIIKIQKNFEDGSISLVVANEQEMNQIDEFMKKINDASNTTTIVDMDKYKWNLSKENNGMINDIINNEWDSLKNAVVAGYEQSISISERGIIVKSLDDPLSWLVIQNGFLAITNDGGNTWKHAISSEGIFGERIFGKIISGVNLIIEDESGVWVTQGSRTTIFDRDKNEQMRIGLVTDSPEQECFGMILDNKKHRVQMTSCEGFMIEKKVSGQWVKKMYANLDGDFWVENFTAKELTILDNDGYFKLVGNKVTISDGKNPVMWMGYIPYGSVPVCAPDTDFGSILKGTNNSLIYMTKNRGFAIDVNCENKFKVDLNGSLYAKDIVTHNLKIVNGELGSKIIFDERDGITINGNNQEQIRLNANEGIAIEVAGEKRFWVGKDGLIYGKKLIILGDETEQVIKDVDGSYVSDLTVNRLKTLNSNDPQNFVHIEDNYLKLKTKYSGTTVEDKFSLEFKGTGADAYPHMTWGTGSQGGADKNIGYMYKTQSRFAWEYVQTDGSKMEMALLNTTSDSILMKTPKGMTIQAGQSFRIEAGGQVFVMDSAGIRVVGTRIDLN